MVQYRYRTIRYRTVLVHTIRVLLTTARWHGAGNKVSFFLERKYEFRKRILVKPPLSEIKFHKKYQLK